MLGTIKRIITISSIVSLILAIPLLLFFRSKMIFFFPENVFYLFLMFSFILLVSLLFYVTIIDKSSKSQFSPYKLGKSATYLVMFGIFIPYFSSVFFDLFILHSMFYTTIMLVVGLMLSFLLTKRSYNLAIFSVLLLFLSYIVSIYAFYPPSLGNDTWRDIHLASTTTYNGFIGGVSSTPYAIPVTSLLYSVISIVFGLSAVYASAFIGLLYISLTAVVVFLITNKLSDKINAFSSFAVLILVLSIPLISLWSVGFIPQAYALTLFLVLLLAVFSAKSFPQDSLMLSPVLCALSFIHGGSVLWIMGFLISLMIVIRFMGRKNVVSYHLLKLSLIIMGLISTIYFIYTTVVSPVINGIRCVLDVLFGVVTNTPISSTVTSNSGSFATALFCYSPIAITVAVAFIAWLDNRRINSLGDAFIETSFVYGSIMLALGVIGTAIFPEAVLDRYLGFGSLFLLAIIAVKGFDIFLKKRRLSSSYLATLLIILTLSVGFGAVLTPDNFFSVTGAYSVRSPPNWSEVLSLGVVSYIASGNILTDWRTGLPMVQMLLSDNAGQMNLSKSEHDIILVGQRGSIDTKLLGSFNLIGSYDYVVKYIDQGGIFIYRDKALDDLSLLTDMSGVQLINELSLHYNKLYDSGSIKIISG